MSNYEKLEELVIDTFLLDPSEYSLDLKRENVDTWDSLGVVSLAVGVHETFGYHFTPEEATSVECVRDVVAILTKHGVEFGDEPA